MWTCPDCRRSFGRTGQGHQCEPGLSEAEYFGSSHPRERGIFEAVHDHLDQFGDVFVEFVQIGIFFKHGPVFAELRTKTRWVALTFKLPDKLNSPRLSRKVVPVGQNSGLWYHVVNVADAVEIDDEILGWLTAAYLSGGSPARARSRRAR